MTTITTEEGIDITIEFDSDGFPTVRIETGGNYQDENDRPAVEVIINDTVIHTMFDNNATENFDSDMLRTLVEGTENWCDYLEENDREIEIEDEYDPALVYAHDYLRNH